MRELLGQLNLETFVLYLADNSPSLPESIPGCELRVIDNGTLEVDITQENSINQVFNFLSQQGINVLSMRNKSNRLEQLFMRLVEKNRHNKELVETLKQTSSESVTTE
jgi:ABC-2 type transport system ATP-binding protein